VPFINEVLVANGVTAFGRVVFTKAVLDMITNSHVLTMAVNNGGTGYVVGETFELSTGTPIGAFFARGVVTAQSGGVVTAVKIVSAGTYPAGTPPTATGGATTNASAAGNDDLTIDVTMEAAKWTVDRNTYVDDTTDFEWICTSTKSTNPPTIGMTTTTSGGNGAARLMVASSYNGIATFDGQPDGSPATAMFLNIAGQNPEILLSTTERRNNIACRDGNNVQYGVLGLFIPLTNSDATYPFPAFVAAQSTAVRAFTDSYAQSGVGANNAGCCNPGTYATIFPAVRFRDNLSAGWHTIASDPSSINVNASMWPHNQLTYSFTHAPQLASQNTNPFTSGVQTKFGDDTIGWFMTPTASSSGVPGVSPFGTGQQMTLVVDAHIVRSQTGDVQVIGIVDGFSNCHGIGLTAFEEIETYLSASRYIVFPDTNGSDIGQWVAMEII